MAWLDSANHADFAAPSIGVMWLNKRWETPNGVDIAGNESGVAAADGR